VGDVGVSYLLRLELPDIPGSLGTVASAIGRAGANIEAVEIVERRGDRVVVDDIVVTLTSDILPDMVVSACQRLEGVRVLWVTRYPIGGGLGLDLETVEHMTNDPADSLGILVGDACDVFRCDWAVGVDLSVDPPKVVVSTSAAPDIPSDALGRLLPIAKPVRLDIRDVPGLELDVVGAVPVGSTSRVIAFGRRGGPEILDSELARLGHLAALAATIEAAAE
jgi:hypothetical protein